MRRGTELRNHILLSAKEVFLELGFQRASMDAIAARADTTKRTLYAHFENKEQLFLAMIELVGDLLAGKLKDPSDYAEDPIDALVLFCGRFQGVLVWGPAVRLYRLFTAETERFPEGAKRAYEVIFGNAQKRMEDFLRMRLGQSRKNSARTAEQLMSLALAPRVIRAFFGIDPISETWQEEAVLDPAFDSELIRNLIMKTVARSNDALR
jgi:AcrR family transcriptional regulator